jgi:hypothetical protein
VNKIDRIKDAAEREKALRSWFLSFLFQGWYNGLKSGPIIENYWIQTYLFEDKYEGARRPDVLMNTPRQKAITTAIGEDSKKGLWNPSTGEGPAVKELLDKYKAEDNAKYNDDGTKKTKEVDSNAVKLKSLKDVTDLIEGEEPEKKPTLLSRIYRIVLKDGGDPEATRLVRNFDKCRKVFVEHREYLPQALRQTLALVLDGVDGSEDTLTKLCLDNITVAETVPVEPTPVEPTPVNPDDVPIALEPTVEAGETFNLTGETQESQQVLEHQKLHDGKKRQKQKKA